MTRSYQQIKNAVTRKGYKWFTGELNLNVVWERTDDNITNLFTDWLHIAYQEGGVDKVISIPATTKPGLKGSILNPVTVAGVTGTAVIIPNQYRGAWEFRDTFTEFSSYPYFRQVGLLDYWRDGDKDQVIDRVQQQDDRLFGTHWHRMSNTGEYGSRQVNNWSLGCMGAPEPEFKKILPVIRKSVALYGKKFTGTILESGDFQ